MFTLLVKKFAYIIICLCNYYFCPRTFESTKNVLKLLQIHLKMLLAAHVNEIVNELLHVAQVNKIYKLLLFTQEIHL